MLLVVAFAMKAHGENERYLVSSPKAQRSTLSTMAGEVVMTMRTLRPSARFRGDRSRDCSSFSKVIPSDTLLYVFYVANGCSVPMLHTL